MDNKSNQETVFFKAGLFIIITLSLLIFSILWLRYFSVTPDKRIIARFKESGPISTGVAVYYKGVDVGKITRIGFSSDYKYTLMELSIYKHLNLPKNVHTEINFEGITGQKYVDIIYPENPSSTMLKDCDVVEGTPSDIQEMKQIISQFVKSGEFESMIKGINEAVANGSKASKRLDSILVMLEKIIKSNNGDINSFIKNAAVSAKNINSVSNSIKGFSNDFSNRGITTRLDKITKDVDKITGDPKLKDSIIKAADEIGSFGESLNKGDLKTVINDTLIDTNRTVNRYDCIGKNFSDLMNQKFLLIKLLFGNPGKNFQKCNCSQYPPKQK